MPVSYTNRKGVTYTLYHGQTRKGKPRYYFGRPGQGQGEPVSEIPPGYTISESVNGVVSLVKDRPTLILPEEVGRSLTRETTPLTLSLIEDRPTLILPEEVAAVETAVQRHPQARRY